MLDAQFDAEIVGCVVSCLFNGRAVSTARVARALGCSDFVAEAFLRRAMCAGAIDRFFDEGWLPVGR